MSSNVMFIILMAVNIILAGYDVSKKNYGWATMWALFCIYDISQLMVIALNK